MFQTNNDKDLSTDRDFFTRFVKATVKIPKQIKYSTNVEQQLKQSQLLNMRGKNA